MRLDLDAHLGVHAQALRVRSQRTELIANNLANADTPGFRARDIDFREALASAAQSGSRAVSVATTHARHIGSAGGEPSTGAQVTSAQVKYRVPLAPSLDGNTVDVQLEQAAFAENAVRYQATLTFLTQRLRGLVTALTGQ
jgi:flagellar basal-body rod protein FlgB